MNVLTVTEARVNLYKLIDQTSESHVPTLIKGKRHNALLISQEDWLAIQETLFLLSIPGMRDSILEGLATPLDETIKTLDW